MSDSGLALDSCLVSVRLLDPQVAHLKQSAHPSSLVEWQPIGDTEQMIFQGAQGAEH